ncbi:MAG: M50 family metallopeptidase [Chloroflexota bacterium]|jgi:hypothetical protein
MENRANGSASLSVLLALGILLFIVLLYTFLHEGGHALVAWLSGGKVFTFDINFFNLGAHITATPHTNLPAQIANSLAGMALPVLAWFVFILSVARRGSLALEVLKIGASAAVLASMLAWVIIPLAFAGGGAPANDDVTGFLRLSGINPYLAAALFGGLTAGMYSLARRRIQDTSALRVMLMDQGGALGWQENRVLYTRILAVAAVVLLLTVIINLAGGGKNDASATIAPPEGYQFIRRIALSEQENRDEVIAAFSRGGGQGGGVFLALSGIKSELIDVRLVGADGSSRTLFHAEGYTANFERVEFTEPLPPGEYKVVLNAVKSQGALAVYLRGR